MMEQIAIRDIQHYLYCPHRWGLMKIDCAWAENYYVVKADLMHKRVHDPDRSYTLRGRKVFTSLSIYCDLPEYGLIGQVDCLEATPSLVGVRMDDSGRCYNLCVVEYKPTAPKGCAYNHDDAMQVFAQKLCIDRIFQCDCTAVLYYADIKKRVPLPFSEEREAWLRELRSILASMREDQEHNHVPPIRKGQKCAGCSMKDLCMPAIKRRFTVKERIRRTMEEAS